MNPKLMERSDSSCELCKAKENLSEFTIEPKDEQIVVCETCKSQIENPGSEDANHWRCLNDSMWSEVPAVQVQAWRMLHRLKSEGWPQDLLDMMYMDDDTMEWAKATNEHLDDSEKVIHKDSNGNVLQAGDTVTLIKDLDVKGANFTAKRGTAVRNITLDPDNAEHIEGRVENQKIVILTKFVKK